MCVCCIPPRFRTDFLIRLIFNSWPSFDSPLEEPDVRRLGLLYYPCTYKPAVTYDATNPNHRLQVNFKDRMGEFAAEFVAWCRVLARATRAGGAKRMLPEPTSSVEILHELMDRSADHMTQRRRIFIETMLRPLGPGEKPSSRKEIEEACAEFLYGDALAKKQEVRSIVRSWLHAPEKLWQGYIGGVQQSKVRVYKFQNTADDTAICTLRTANI